MRGSAGNSANEVLFICGTDEHGTPTELAAADAGLPIREFCDRQHARQADIYRRFGLSFDHFGRSSSPANHALTQHFYCQLDEAGLIEERDVQQVWSPGDRRFLPDRYIVGTCPHCGAQDARGDQCEACGIEPDMQIARIRLSDKTFTPSPTTHGTSCPSRHRRTRVRLRGRQRI
jgi:methionyl-tRNA synthetase